MSTTTREPRSRPAAATWARLSGDPGVERLMRGLAAAGSALLAGIVFIGMAVRAMPPLSDPDTWWHLRLGHDYWAGRSITHPGRVSYFGTKPWTSRDWLTQLTAAKLDDWFGLPGVAWLYGFGLVMLALVLFRTCRRKAGFGVSLMATALGLLGAMGSLTPRPQLASFVLLAVTTGALLRTVDDKRTRWWLALLTGVWACMHGMWFLGIGMQVLVPLGMLLDRGLTLRTLRAHAVLPLSSVAAVAVTPNGLSLLRHPLGESMGASPYISEYASPSLHSFAYVASLAMLALVVLTWARRGRGTWVDILLVAFAAAMIHDVQRTITVGAVVLTPVLATCLQTWFPQVGDVLSRRAERLVVSGSVVLGLVLLAVVAPHSADEPSTSYPIALDAQLRSIPKQAVVFDDLEYGGYLMWKYPDMRIVADGLNDQYPVQWLIDYFHAAALRPGWQQFLQRTGASYALLNKGVALIAALELLHWQVIGQTDTVLLLRAPSVGG